MENLFKLLGDLKVIAESDAKTKIAENEKELIKDEDDNYYWDYIIEKIGVRHNKYGIDFSRDDMKGFRMVKDMCLNTYKSNYNKSIKGE